MAFIWDPEYSLNLLFCIIIILLSFWGYRKTNSKTAIYIGLAFIFYGLNHLMVLLGMGAMKSTIIIIRTLGYLLTIYAMYLLAAKKK
jgi:hypothetical protein